LGSGLKEKIYEFHSWTPSLAGQQGKFHAKCGKNFEKIN